jgi:hypothetical protein
MSIHERLMRYASPEPTSGCWLWTASLDGKGYGQLGVLTPTGKRPRRAHRLMLQHHTGMDGEGLDACHRCDNRACVNPDHLYWGTRKHNLADMVQRNRQWAQKLTADAARDIVARVASGEQYKSIAADYGVERAAVCAVIRGRTWGHVTGIKMEAA